MDYWPCAYQKARCSVDLSYLVRFSYRSAKLTVTLTLVCACAISPGRPIWQVGSNVRTPAPCYRLTHSTFCKTPNQILTNLNYKTRSYPQSPLWLLKYEAWQRTGAHTLHRGLYISLEFIRVLKIYSMITFSNTPPPFTPFKSKLCQGRDFPVLTHGMRSSC